MPQQGTFFLTTPLGLICLSLFALLCCVYTVRHYLNRSLESSIPLLPPSQSGAQLPALPNALIQPAEIAYLIRGGDVTHTLIVLAVDLVQRASKTQQDVTFSDGLSEYEKNMFKIVSRTLKEWAIDKAHSTVLGGAKNPIQIVKRLAFLYNFIRNSLAGLIAELLADPRRIKRYFSPQGLLRIIADFTAAGYKQAFHEELRKDLLRRGLLVPERVREKLGQYYFLTAALALIGSGAVALMLVGPNSGVAIVTWITTLLCAFYARTILSLRQFIPMYDEIAIVAEQIARKSIRLAGIRLLLRSVNGLMWCALVLGMALLSGIGLLIVKFALAGSFPFTAYVFIVFMISHFAIADLVFNGFKLLTEECPTPAARAELEKVRKELEHTSPLDAFRSTLSTDSYDPTLSRLLAVYGVELLLILA